MVWSKPIQDIGVAKSKAAKYQARDFAMAVARVAGDRHADDIVLLDLRDTSPITDYFVIATGTSDRQIRALADEIEELGAKGGQKVWKVAGRDSAGWIVMDFVDVVVHLFNEELRGYYDLEMIWGEVPRVDWNEDRS